QAQAPSWSHFKRLVTQLAWVDALGDTTVWMDSLASRKITDFAGEADAADASELKAYAPVKRVALIALMKALLVQSGGLGAVTKTVEGFGGFARQYEQIERVSAHHGNFWEVLLYGQIGRDRALMFDLAEKLEFTATSEDGRVLDALAHAQRNEAA